MFDNDTKIEEKTMNEYKYFKLVLFDGDILPCKYKEMTKYNLRVETGRK